jgi:hypothetical protein
VEDAGTPLVAQIREPWTAANRASIAAARRAYDN